MKLRIDFYFITLVKILSDFHNLFDQILCVFFVLDTATFLVKSLDLMHHIKLFHLKKVS